MAEEEQQQRSGGLGTAGRCGVRRRRPGQRLCQPARTADDRAFARGRQLLAGNFVSGGQVVERPDTDIWDMPFADPWMRSEVHGFAWLDDLAAVGDSAARKRAQDWT